MNMNKFLTFAAFWTLSVSAESTICGPGLYEVSVVGGIGVYCIDQQPCSGEAATSAKRACPGANALNAEGDAPLTEGSCCSFLQPGSDTVGCVSIDHPSASCVGSDNFPQVIAEPASDSVPTSPLESEPSQTTQSLSQNEDSNQESLENEESNRETLENEVSNQENLVGESETTTDENKEGDEKKVTKKKRGFDISDGDTMWIVLGTSVATIIIIGFILARERKLRMTRSASSTLSNQHDVQLVTEDNQASAQLGAEADGEHSPRLKVSIT